MSLLTLSDMKIHQKGRIVGYKAGDEHYRRRLMAMGLLPGTEFYISRIAPLGDPVELTIRGFALSLRKNEANILDIERVSE
ncbi:MAG: FeoA family protein [Gammaproteobacteria bacterium]|nr:FeoA family protein [Gammaproteobacteria bacterium]